MSSTSPMSEKSDDGIGPGRIRKYASQDPESQAWKLHKRHFFILSSAGKPIYSRYGNEDKLSSLMAVIQVLVSHFASNDDTLRSIHTSHFSVTFLVRSPLYFVLVSSHSPDTQTVARPLPSDRDQLMWLHHQIISIITASQLTKIYKQHSNFDLRRLLGGCEPFLDHLCTTLPNSPQYLLSAINSLRIPVTIRTSVASCLSSCTRVFSAQHGLLYALLIVGNSLVTVLRPKRFSFHPSDLHLIFNMVNSSTSFRSVPESWLPICLPKFNDSGFLHCYVSFITPNYPGLAQDLCLVLVCNDRDAFHEMSACRKSVIESLTGSGALFLLQDSIRNAAYTVQELGIAGLRHFLFKSKPNIQFTQPQMGEPYGSEEEVGRLYAVYHSIRSRMYNRALPLKICFHVGDCESVFAWITPNFELFATFSPLVTKPNATHAVNALLRWINCYSGKMKYFVQLSVGEKKYTAAGVSTDNCQDVAEFKSAIKKAFSPLLDRFDDSAQLTLFKPDDD